MYRAPKATRDGELLDLPMWGDPADIGPWSPALTLEDRAVSEPAPAGSAPATSQADLRESAAVLLASAWPPSGERVDARLALAGVCARSGWSREDAVDFACRVHAHVPDRKDASDAMLAGMVDTAIAKHRRGERVYGWKRLGEILPPAIVQSARGLLKPGANDQANFDLNIGGDDPTPEPPPPRK